MYVAQFVDMSLHMLLCKLFRPNEFGPCSSSIACTYLPLTMQLGSWIVALRTRSIARHPDARVLPRLLPPSQALPSTEKTGNEYMRATSTLTQPGYYRLCNAWAMYPQILPERRVPAAQAGSTRRFSSHALHGQYYYHGTRSSRHPEWKTCQSRELLRQAGAFLPMQCMDSLLADHRSYA